MTRPEDDSEAPRRGPTPDAAQWRDGARTDLTESAASLRQSDPSASLRPVDPSASLRPVDPSASLRPVDPSASLRLDKWLWFARFFKTRSLAAAQITGGHVRVNGTRATKPAQAVRPGDTLTFAQGRAVRIVRIEALPARRGPAPEARATYDDLSPPAPPSAAELGAPEPLAGRVGRKERRAGRLSRQGPLD